MAEERFLIDANSFITPCRSYYAFDLIPTYWNRLSENTSTKRLVLLDLVKDEIDRGSDDLAAWLDSQDDFIICNHVDSDIINQYRQIMQYLQNCGLYKRDALNLWAQRNVADPWLIAAAKAYNYTIITAEVPSGGLSAKNQNRHAKIPDVAKAFDVRTENLYYMMRELNIKI